MDRNDTETPLCHLRHCFETTNTITYHMPFYGKILNKIFDFMSLVHAHSVRCGCVADAPNVLITNFNLWLMFFFCCNSVVSLFMCTFHSNLVVKKRTALATSKHTCIYNRYCAFFFTSNRLHTAFIYCTHSEGDRENSISALTDAALSLNWKITINGLEVGVGGKMGKNLSSIIRIQLLLLLIRP